MQAGQRREWKARTPKRTLRRLSAAMLAGVLCASCGTGEDTGQQRQQDEALAVQAPASGPPAAATDSSIVRLCADTAPVEQCRCAMPALEDEFGDALADYERVASQFLPLRAEGMEYVPAWDAAVAAAAADLGIAPHQLQARMNPIGSAHSAARRACAQ